jgi:hypothetical protein
MLYVQDDEAHGVFIGVVIGGGIWLINTGVTGCKGGILCINPVR